MQASSNVVGWPRNMASHSSPSSAASINAQNDCLPMWRFWRPPRVHWKAWTCIRSMHDPCHTVQPEEPGYNCYFLMFTERAFAMPQKLKGYFTLIVLWRRPLALEGGQAFKGRKLAICLISQYFKQTCVWTWRTQATWCHKRNILVQEQCYESLTGCVDGTS